jgi:hypothetical protein
VSHDAVLEATGRTAAAIGDVLAQVLPRLANPELEPEADRPET